MCSNASYVDLMVFILQDHIKAPSQILQTMNMAFGDIRVEDGEWAGITIHHSSLLAW